MCDSNHRSVSGKQAIGRALETGKHELSVTTAPALALKHRHSVDTFGNVSPKLMVTNSGVI